MAAAAAAWDVLAKAANLAQMSGLHVAMLVAVFTTLLRVQQSNMRECARLERCHRRLHALLQWPASGGVALLLPSSETGDPLGEALADAAGLVESYKKSTLWRRLWSGGRMATQLRDMQGVVDSYCGLLLFVNAHLLLQQQAVHRPPRSSDTSTTIPEVNDDTSQSPSAQAVTSRPAVASTHPPSTATSTTIPEVKDETSQSPSAQAVTSRPADKGTHDGVARANDFGQGRMDYDPSYWI